MLRGLLASGDRDCGKGDNVTQTHVILLDGPLAGQRVKAALKGAAYKHRESGTEYRLGWVVMFRCHLRVGWSSYGSEPNALDCARWLTSEVVKQQLDDLWRGSGVGQLTEGARVAAAEYKANAAIPPMEQPVDRDALGEVVRRAEAYMQARRRAAIGAHFPWQDKVIAEALVLDDGVEDGQGFTPLREDDLLKLIAAAKRSLEVEAELEDVRDELGFVAKRATEH